MMVVYFIVLVVNALIERELRRAMKAQKVESLPLYPEDRLCRGLTTKRVITSDSAPIKRADAICSTH